MSLRRYCPPGFEFAHGQKANWCIRPEWRERLSGEGSPDWLALTEETRAKCIKLGEGRTIWRVVLNQETTVFLKAFEPSTGLRSWIRNVILGSPPHREQAALSEAQRRNIPSPTCLAMGSEKKYAGREFILLEAVDDAAKLTEAWNFITQRSPGSIDHRASVQLIKTIAELFASAHEQGFTHRDAHPENVLVQKDADGRFVVFFLDLMGARFSRSPVSMKAAARSIAQLNQWAKRHTTRAQRQRFVRHYLRRRLHVPPAYVGVPGEQRMAHEIVRTGVVHAASLARARDKRLRRQGKYFARLRLANGWTARVTVALERRELFGDDVAPDRSIEDWRAAFRTLASESQSESFAGVRTFQVVADHWLTKIVWTLTGSPCRKAFVRAHQLRHRDIAAPLMLGFAEHRGSNGLIDSAILLLPEYAVAKTDNRVPRQFKDDREFVLSDAKNVG